MDNKKGGVITKKNNRFKNDKLDINNLDRVQRNRYEFGEEFNEGLTIDENLDAELEAPAQNNKGKYKDE